MKILSFLNRHSWYSDRANAYADSELSPAEASRFESHLSGCERCTVDVAAAREIRVAMTRLPEVEIPRSFRLTPQMVAEAPRKARPASAPVYVGLARAGAALSVAAFAVVFVVGTLSSNSSSDQSASREAAAGAPAGDFNAVPEQSLSEKSGDPESEPQLAPAASGGGVSGSALLTPAPGAVEPVQPDVRDDGAAPAGADAGTRVGAADDTSALSTIGYEPANQARADDDDVVSPALLITGAIAAGFVLLLAGLETARRVRSA